MDEDGRCGYGEGVPRGYVTGETIEQALAGLETKLLPPLIDLHFPPEQVLELLDRVFDSADLDQWPAAACALETALWDLASQYLQVEAGAMLGGISAQRTLTYSAVIPMTGREELSRFLAIIGSYGLRQIKFKVGRPDDLDCLAYIRETLGPDVSLRVDANAAWKAEEAVERINAMAPFGVEAVEQPVAKEDIRGLAYVRQNTEPLLLVDESVCTPSDARLLIDNEAVDGFNLRLSKCGGPSRTAALLAMAGEAGLRCMLGCQVGELGLLSAAGRHFAAAHPDLIYLEGALTRFLVAKDIIDEDLSFGPGGRAAHLTGPGLGVTVREEAFQDNLIFSLS